jgi:hypothetical protein
MKKISASYKELRKLLPEQEDNSWSEFLFVYI